MKRAKSGLGKYPAHGSFSHGPTSVTNKFNNPASMQQTANNFMHTTQNRMASTSPGSQPMYVHHPAANNSNYSPEQSSYENYG